MKHSWWYTSETECSGVQVRQHMRAGGIITARHIFSSSIWAQLRAKSFV